MDRLTKAQSLIEQSQALQTEAYNLIESYKQDNKPQDKPNLFIYVNAGHGGLDKEGNYHTFPSHGKYYTFLDAQGNEIFTSYEGNTNRLIANEFMQILEDNNVDYMQIHNDIEDMANGERIAKANQHYQTIQYTHKACWVSFHSNAQGMVNAGDSQPAQGYMVITSPNTTKSDGIAKNVFEAQKAIVGNEIQYRTDITDLDKNPDYDIGFYELTGTLMNALLMENLFFTNIEDAEKLLVENYQKQTAQATWQGVWQSFEQGIM